MGDVYPGKGTWQPIINGEQSERGKCMVRGSMVYGYRNCVKF